MEVKPQKNIELSDEEIEEIKEIIGDKEIIEDEDLEVLKKDKNKAGCDRICLGRIFLKCYDTLRYNLYLLSGKKVIYDKLRDFLNEFEDIEKIKNNFEHYKDGEEFGSYYDAENIKAWVSKNKESVDNLIQLFFNIFGGED